MINSGNATRFLCFYSTQKPTWLLINRTKPFSANWFVSAEIFEMYLSWKISTLRSVSQRGAVTVQLGSIRQRENLCQQSCDTASLTLDSLERWEVVDAAAATTSVPARIIEIPVQGDRL